MLLRGCRGCIASVARANYRTSSALTRRRIAAAAAARLVVVCVVVAAAGAVTEIVKRIVRLIKDFVFLLSTVCVCVCTLRVRVAVGVLRCVEPPVLVFRQIAMADRLKSLQVGLMFTCSSSIRRSVCVHSTSFKQDQSIYLAQTPTYLREQRYNVTTRVTGVGNTSYGFSYFTSTATMYNRRTGCK